jgi:hypothetical protein
MTRRGNAATVIGSSGSVSEAPSERCSSSWCPTKSKRRSSEHAPPHSAGVASPRGVSRKATFQKWFRGGVRARHTFPTTGVHMWSVS